MEPIFPGMDPYLEAPHIWPGFHEAFLSYVREALQPVLPEGYYAELQTREEVGIAGLGTERSIYPDVAVKEAERPLFEPDPPAASGAGTPVTRPEHLVIAEETPMEVSFLEIREVGGERKLVTLLELLSPSNKLPGADRDSFLRKQRDVFSSETHWVEIDLLRAGRRVGGHPTVDPHCRARGYDYVVVVSRSDRRSPLDLEIFGFRLRDSLPAIPVPLRRPDPDVALDLGVVFRRAYETGPYRKMLRYDLPPDPPLREDDATWARDVAASRSR